MTDLILMSGKSTRDQLSKKSETLKTLDIQIPPKLNEAEDLERAIIVKAEKGTCRNHH